MPEHGKSCKLSQLIGRKYIQDAPTDHGKSGKLSQLIGRKYIHDAPTDQGNLSGYPTDWKEISEMPQRTEGNLSSCLNWLAGIMQFAPTYRDKFGQIIPTILAGNIQGSPTDQGKFGKLSQLISRRYLRFPNWPRKICQVVTTDWQEISKMPHLTMGNLSSCLKWLAGKLKMPQRTERISQVIPLIGRN